MKTRPFAFLFSLLSVFLVTCVNHEFPATFNCSTTDLVIDLVATSNPVSCDVNNGVIDVSASGGIPPYKFRLGSGSFGSLSRFSDLGAGSFIVTVQDARGCEKQLTNIAIVAPSGPMAERSAIDPQTSCTDPNGSITVHAIGGNLPYQYKIGDGDFGDSPIFSDLPAGLYTITVTDAAECTIEVNEVIMSKTGVSYNANIKPILVANCIKSGCHNGDNGGDRNWNIFSNVQTRAEGIRARTGNRSMPPGDVEGLLQNEIDLIACWVNEGAKNN